LVSLSVGESFARERELLRGLPAEPPSTAEEATPWVDSKALITIKQNRYSVPVRLAGLRVHGRVGAREIECHHGGELIARHERQQGPFGVAASLDHYLELLARKPGALAGSLALSQERERGAWSSVFDQLWGKIAERYGASEAARQMVDVLMLARERGAGEVELAVRGALAAGAHDGRAVAVLASRGSRVKPGTLDELPSRLAGLGSPPAEPRPIRRAARDGRSTMSAPAKVQAMEALIDAHAREHHRVIARYARTELVVLDELGYLALPEGAAELVFQVISERNERASLIVTTNLPFGEWTKVFPDARVAKAVVDRITHRAHSIDTGAESWRFRHGLTRAKQRGAA
jgi:hypothetical protein